MRDFAVLLDAAGKMTSFMSCGDDGFVRQWDLTFNCVMSKRAHKSTIRAMMVTIIPQVGTFLITGSDDTYINVWEVGTGTMQQVTRLPCLVGVASLRVVTLQEERMKDGAKILVQHPALISGHSDGSVKIWTLENIRAIRLLAIYRVHTDVVRSLLVAPPFFVTGGYDSQIVLWAPQTFAILA